MAADCPFWIYSSSSTCTLYHITMLVWNQKLQNCSDRSTYCCLCVHLGCYAHHVVAIGAIPTFFIVWMLVAISTPSTIALIPLTALIGIHFPISSMLSHARCKHQRHGESNPQATLHVSSNGIEQPSHTTWNPLHSTNEHSEVVPIARGQQHQHYGSNA